MTFFKKILRGIFHGKETDKNTSIYIQVDNNTAELLPRTKSSDGNGNIEVPDPILYKKEEDVLPNPFHNRFRENIIDYSHLTPEEAKDELKARKDAGEYLDSEEWCGYQDVIASRNDEKYLEKISSMSAEETEKWFRRNIEREIKMSTSIWEAVCDEVAPIHEPILLDMLSKISPGRVEGWVNARKREGYFFTDYAYHEAYEKSKTWVKREKNVTLGKKHYVPVDENEKRKLETIKKNIRRNRLRMQENPENELYKKLYDEYMEAYEMITGEKYQGVNTIG
jgi:hypothetical protein